MGLKKFKNIHCGETCYIFGDGPSIKYFDLSQFNNYIGISCGRQIFHKDFETLNIKYYAVPEPFLFVSDLIQPYKYIKDFRPLTNLLKEKIEKMKSLNFFFNLTNYFSIHGCNYHFIHRYTNPFFNVFNKFTRDPFSGSLQTCLSLAFILGFKKVYLIGHDSWTMKYSSSQRWFEIGIGLRKQNFESFDDPFFKAIKEKIEIVSIIPDGNSINFNSKTYLEFTKKRVEYKENYELTDINYLNVFDQYPLYKIFN